MSSGIQETAVSLDSYEQLRQFIEENADTLVKALCVYIHNAGLAEGTQKQELALTLLGELALEALKNAERFDPSHPTKAWLLGIAVNLVKREKDRQITNHTREPLLSDLHHGSRTRYYDEDFLDGLMGHSGRSIEDRVIGEEQVEEMLSLVPENDRVVLRLSVLDGFSGPELADVLGCSPGAARVRLHRAVNRLATAWSNGEGR